MMCGNSGDQPMSTTSMKTIARFDAPEDAYLMRAFLGSRGVETAVLDEHISQLFWHYRQLTGGTRLVLLNDEDLEEALEISEEYFSAINAQPSQVTEIRGWPVVLLLSWSAGLPLPIFGRRTLKLED